MKQWLELGNRYAKESTWKDFALLKFCLAALGLALGTQVPNKYKRPALCLSLVVFLLTYLPLMAKLLRLASRQEEA